MQIEEFRPAVTAFCCNWCSYAGADLAGGSRLSYPTEVKIIRVPCSCRVNLLFILRALERGADGVVIAGCHPGDCHYSTGNYYARRRLTLFLSMLDFLGIEKGRMLVEWISAAEGVKFAATMTEFVKKVTTLGPNRRLSDLRVKPDRQILGSDSLIDLEQPTDNNAETPDYSETARFVHETAEKMLASGEVSRVLGWSGGDFDYEISPAVFKDVSALSGLIFNEFCGANLCKYLMRFKGEEGKTLVFLKPCDAKGFERLKAENQVDGEAVVAIPLTCGGMKGQNGALTKCADCAEKTGGDASNRFAGVLKLESATVDERYAFWREKLSTCIRCNACRNACPVCSCVTCVFDNQTSGFETKANYDDFEEKLFHIIRAYHVAGRCVDCGECERVCPNNIPLSLLNRENILVLEKLYGDYHVDSDEAANPLLEYSLSDKEPREVYSLKEGSGLR